MVGEVVPHPQVVVGTLLLEQKGVGVEPILEEVGEQYQEKGNTTMDLQDGIENLVKKLMEVDAVDFLPTVVLVFIELVQGKILIFLNGPMRTLLKPLKLGMVSHKMTLITIFGHKHLSKISMAFDFRSSRFRYFDLRQIFLNPFIG